MRHHFVFLLIGQVQPEWNAFVVWAFPVSLGRQKIIPVLIFKYAREIGKQCQLFYELSPPS